MYNVFGNINEREYDDWKSAKVRIDYEDILDNDRPILHHGNLILPGKGFAIQVNKSHHKGSGLKSNRCVRTGPGSNPDNTTD